MKKVTILYFAGIKDLAGVPSEEMSLPDEVRTVADFARHLGEQRAALKNALGAVRIARNETFASQAEPVEAGDVLALIPPVQGG
jgi:molybdopterin synthase sulfur carrier subunit